MYKIYPCFIPFVLLVNIVSHHSILRGLCKLKIITGLPYICPVIRQNKAQSDAMVSTWLSLKCQIFVQGQNYMVLAFITFALCWLDKHKTIMHSVQQSAG
ncbi:hypothetical protein CHS0354_037260 [Potamilus streckersoni]|uniref:Uncharacterized protein n=1 Tax=Potamilus streckersoni TaxID=2493646 RepID=A0AAE0W3I8_9BIVA|nr:hypothetical protein CHS0354_037260 [Potamilus streckersoni]